MIVCPVAEEGRRKDEYQSDLHEVSLSVRPSEIITHIAKRKDDDLSTISVSV